MSSGSVPRVALVTGGAVRVGRAIVEAFADRGYAVAIHANRSVDQAHELARLLDERGVSTLVESAELRSPDAIRGMIDRVCLYFGRLDVLVNNAAIWSPKPLEEVTAADVLEYFEINSLATFVGCQHAGLKMVEQEQGGVILNIGDWSVARPYTDYAAYFPSKGTIPTMTRLFAVELSRRNPLVRVNAILPGPVIFPPDLPEADRQKAIGETLVQRAGAPENVAHAAIFLVENDFVTGVCLPVDGGRTISS
ncbi:MAG: SDR family oxidoreductase [Planctomycetales bacterium]|nr:SDR family oxidoreductase [Planctomycetales bacterium]